MQVQLIQGLTRDMISGLSQMGEWLIQQFTQDDEATITELSKGMDHRF